jgi:hypothetical protein
MQTIRLRTRITSDHKIELQLPADTPVTDAEVIILIEPAVERAVGDSLQSFFDRLDQSARPRLAAEEVDRWIENERNAWD